MEHVQRQKPAVFVLAPLIVPGIQAQAEDLFTVQQVYIQSLCEQGPQLHAASVLSELRLRVGPAVCEGVPCSLRSRHRGCPGTPAAGSETPPAERLCALANQEAAGSPPSETRPPESGTACPGQPAEACYLVFRPVVPCTTQRTRASTVSSDSLRAIAMKGSIWLNWWQRPPWWTICTETVLQYWCSSLCVSSHTTWTTSFLVRVSVTRLPQAAKTSAMSGLDLQVVEVTHCKMRRSRELRRLGNADHMQDTHKQALQGQ